MKKLWLLSILALGIVGAACDQGDPAPTEGDAEITKDMPEKQTPPPAAKAREEATPSGGGALVPPPSNP